MNSDKLNNIITPLNKDCNHAKILFYEDDTECDMCDNKRTCVVIETLSGDGLVVCIKCLENIIVHSK